MSKIWRSAQPSRHDIAQDAVIKSTLTQKLGASVKCLQQQHIDTYQPIYSGDIADNVCHYLEAIFIHGLKDTFFEKMSAILSNNPDRSPTPNFWPLLMIFSHKDVISQINNLSQLNTDVGRCRAWIRVALNDGLLDSYLSAMVQDHATMEYYYRNSSYLRDSEQPDILKRYIEGLNPFQFKLACNSHTLNIWSTTPLILAGVWSPPLAPEPVVTGIDVAMCFDDEGRPVTPVPDRKKKLRTRVKHSAELHHHRQSSESLAIDNAMATYSGSETSSPASCPDPIPNQQRSLDSVSIKSESGDVPKTRLEIVEDPPSDVRHVVKREMEADAQSQSSLSDLTCAIPLGNDSLWESSLNDRSGTPEGCAAVDDDPGEARLDDDDGGHCFGNSLLGKITWSSTFEEKDDGGIRTNCSSSQKIKSDAGSFQDLLRNYSPVHASVLQTPDFSDSFGTLVLDHRRNKPKEQETQTSSPESYSDDDKDFEILPKTCSVTSENADQRTRDLVAVIGKICNEVGLDAQNYKCKACARPIGMIYGKARVCHYDGYSYCYECHDDDESVIPSRIVYNWDFKKYKVSKHTKRFLQLIEEEPLIDVKQINPQLYMIASEMNELQQLRMQLSYLRLYLFTCRESVAEKMRRRLWPKEYLYEHIHQYSFADLVGVPTRSLAQLLGNLVAEGIKHVKECDLCRQKAFICEICNSANVIFPFELNTTYRCEKCSAVYHSMCMNESKPCPKCERRRKRFNDHDDEFVFGPDD